MARKVPGTWSMAQAEEIERLKTQRDDLLEALRELLAHAEHMAPEDRGNESDDITRKILDRARAVLGRVK